MKRLLTLFFLTALALPCFSQSAYTIPDSLPVLSLHDTVASLPRYPDTASTRYHYTGRYPFNTLVWAIQRKFRTIDAGLSSVAWSKLGNPAGNLTLAMASRRTVFGWTNFTNGGSGGAFTLYNSGTLQDPVLEVYADSADIAKNVWTVYVKNGSHKSGIALQDNGTFYSFGSTSIVAANSYLFKGNSTVAIADGGTNATAQTAGKLMKYNGTAIVTSSIDTAVVNPERALVYPWVGQAVKDSTAIVLSFPSNATVDSILAKHRQGTTTINVTKIHSGTASDLLSSNYSATTSVASASGLQNNTLVIGDMLYGVIRSISATDTVTVQINYHVTP